MADIYDGTEGDDALAAGYPVMDGSEDWRDGWKSVNKTRDLLATGLATVRAWVTDTIAALWPLSVARGGTGATSANGARVAIQAWGNSGAVAAGNAPSLGWNGQRLVYDVPGYANGTLANLGDANTSAYDGLLNPAVYSRSLTGWRSVGIQSDGTIGNTSSARRFKENITPLNITDEQIAGLELVEFDWKADGTHDVGLIADDVEQVLPWAVFHDENGLVLGIHYERLALALLPALQRLTERVAQLEGK
jgi:hypothetical protein